MVHKALFCFNKMGFAGKQKKPGTGPLAGAVQSLHMSPWQWPWLMRSLFVYFPNRSQARIQTNQIS